MMETVAMEVAVTDMVTARDVLAFWFDVSDDKDWWAGSQAFDAQVRIRFAKTLVAAEKSELWTWRATPQGRLAEIIVLDQFSRQLYRQSGRAFGNDALALALAQELVARDELGALDARQRPFALLPYMHSESLAIHEAAMPLFERWTDDNTVKFERAHADTIRRFGRYPKRNEALGRPSSPDEIAYIKERGGSMF